METSARVTVTATFRLHPGFHVRWAKVWKELRIRALADPGCLDFRLLHNHRDEQHCAILSEWVSRSAFNAFTRRVGLIWIDRDIDGTVEPAEYTIYEALPLEGEETVHTHTQELVSLRR